MRILLASSNPHKVEEIRSVWAELARNTSIRTVELIGLDALNQPIEEPIEDSPTFEGNAILKARYYSDAAGLPCLADDSGLEVDVLNGEPGVRSARYAGVCGPRSDVDPANNRLLIKRLGQISESQRTARFVSVLAFCRFPMGRVKGGPNGSDPDCDLVIARGAIEGRILTSQEAGEDVRGRGTNGFGYDPLFFIPRLNKTTGELSGPEKNAISHRGQAARQMWNEIHKSL